jgi:hypothetical protein
MKVGFTGTQQGMTWKQKDQFFHWLWDNLIDEFHHGDCIGADSEAHEIVYYQYGVPIIIHPPLNPDKRMYNGNAKEIRPQKEYFARNRDIVDETDILIAAPKTLEEELRSGTWATIRYARKMGKQVIILEP